MSKTVNCILLKQELPALPMPPFPGELGLRIHENVSAQAWSQWLNHQTMLINENRLSMGNADHRKYLMEQAEKFLFGGEFDKPEGYKPPTD